MPTFEFRGTQQELSWAILWVQFVFRGRCRVSTRPRCCWGHRCTHSCSWGARAGP